VDIETLEQFQQAMNEKKSFVRAPWCENISCEEAIKAETKATPRVLEMELIDQKGDYKCFHCSKPASRKWLFAQSY
jgi:prolyl-tRNA synthetase